MTDSYVDSSGGRAQILPYWDKAGRWPLQPGAQKKQDCDALTQP